MKIRSFIVASIASVSLTACTYTITGKHEKVMTDNLMSAERCTFAPLWLAPANEEFTNIDTIARDKGIKDIKYAKQKIYPYVLFTRYCTVVKGQ